MYKKISIIIPARNEESNITELLSRIHATLQVSGMTYEIILIDDHSTDKTVAVAKKFAQNDSIRIYKKIGKPGKAQSLIEGFSYANYKLLLMIDADLQYPPEEITEMVKKINKGADIVVANRVDKKTHFIRNILSNGYHYFFGKILHNFNCDVQSGMKLFKKEIIERITLDPTPWTFDLEFLIKARNAGYKIDTVAITFSKRISGETKIQLHKAIVQIGWSALRYRFKHPEIIPFHPQQEKKKGKGFHYKGKEFIHHSDLNQTQTAFHRVTRLQKILLLELFIIISMSFILNWHLALIIIIAGLTMLYFTDLLFNLFLIFLSFTNTGDISIEDNALDKVSDDFWPEYTVLCPLYKEWEVVPQFVTAISKFSYPKNKLQVMLLLEADDKETIKQIKQFNLPAYFQIVIIPKSLPKTKPKACNYGLQFAKGKYVVIYDAEDVPDPLQLKKSVLAFEKTDKKVICIQAKLNFYNPQQNYLTKLFTAEYSLWFDLVLTGLNTINAPIPLGGTSNHFITEKLREIKGWDSFNVTEDADLGMRIMKFNYKTAILDSTTFEEANSMFFNWIKQRSRWIKGYMQTYLVHTRTTNNSFKDTFTIRFAIFQIVVGGKVLTTFINPVMWTITILYFAFRSLLGTTIESFFPAPVLYMAVCSMIFGNFLYLYFYLMGLAKRGHYEIIPSVLFLVPLYALMMSFSAWQAFYSLLKQPFHWSKTKHGLHLQYKKDDDSLDDITGEKIGSYAFEGTN